MFAFTNIMLLLFIVGVIAGGYFGKPKLIQAYKDFGQWRNTMKIRQLEIKALEEAAARAEQERIDELVKNFMNERR